MKKIFTCITALFFSGVVFSQTALVNQTLMITHPGQGLSGLDASATQVGLGATLYGAGNQQALNHWVAEKIIVPGSGWVTDSLITYGYQTGSGTTSTFNGLYCYIAKDSSAVPSNSFVSGNKSSNTFVSTNFTNIFRTPNETTSLTDGQRPIMKLKATLSSTLSGGTYWVVWATTGSGSSGPWIPPVTKLGMLQTGNAVQSTTAGIWNPCVDGSNTLGMPFKLYGQGVTTTSMADENSAVNEISIAPNPVVTNATVRIELSLQSGLKIDDVAFRVYDQLGREVLNYNNISLAFDIERGTLSSGTYLYKVINKSNGTSINSGKLIFQ